MPISHEYAQVFWPCMDRPKASTSDTVPRTAAGQADRRPRLAATAIRAMYSRKQLTKTVLSPPRAPKWWVHLLGVSHSIRKARP
jgi:hypothetical protein